MKIRETILRDVAEILEQMERNGVRRLITEDGLIQMVVDVDEDSVLWTQRLTFFLRFMVQILSLRGQKLQALSV